MRVWAGGVMADPDELLTTTQVAAVLQLTPRRVKQLMQEGQLRPERKLGNYNVFRRGDVEAFARVPRRRGRPPHTAASGTSDGRNQDADAD